MLQLAQYRRFRSKRNDPLYLATRLEQAEAAALAADSIEVIQAHATMALHYRARLNGVRA
jgi:hypothetical protein